ncbi:outer membrane protein assembly factor BamD [Autumnicola psychrophila]|uniref:Outer membrane protein assembly factor BamD n=1 Tax=Autumnicola psychrophila TaxID=3075592 RepID=A0ABU3DU80_9FLAO|nr:outer membrane protein assembly factor BamD [Zunongwangia sp. F225]MDT0687264.1 outer membrane protein assembly factor BamD [Zunongwangia sp. F225]
MMKKGILLLCVLLIVSCGEYQKMLKSEDTGEKYAYAENLYNEGVEEDSNRKLRKALRLFEQLMPQLRGKPQGQRISYLVADAYYQVGDYLLASFEFERFLQTYPESEKAEEAMFKMAASNYYESPRYFLDQTETDKAIVLLQTYLDTYPEGEYVEQANDMATELRIKLERKAYEIAKQYHKTMDYKAAVVSFDNFITTYPGSPFREAAFYYKFDSAYELAINSYLQLMEERLVEAKEYYTAYRKYYPEGEYGDAIEASLDDIDARLQNF